MQIYGPGTKLKDGDVEIEIGTLCQRKDERELDLSSGDRHLAGKKFLRMEKRDDGDHKRLAFITQCEIAYIWIIGSFDDLKIIGDINNIFNSPILSAKKDPGSRDDWPKFTITTKKGSTSFTHIDRIGA